MLEILTNPTVKQAVAQIEQVFAAYNDISHRRASEIREKIISPCAGRKGLTA